MLICIIFYNNDLELFKKKSNYNSYKSYSYGYVFQFIFCGCIIFCELSNCFGESMCFFLTYDV